MRIEDSDALIVVDVQNDFCSGGALPVDRGEQVVRHINRMQLKFDVLVFTRDWHPHDHCSFSDDPEFRDGSWPTHCVEHTPGAEFQGDLHVPLDAIILDKATDADTEAYSAFENRGLAERLRAKGISRVFVAGLATDYCVRATALDAKKEGFDTLLIEDACRGVTPETTEEALEEMTAAGIILCQSRDVAE